MGEEVNITQRALDNKDVRLTLPVDFRPEIQGKWIPLPREQWDTGVMAIDDPYDEKQLDEASKQKLVEWYREIYMPEQIRQRAKLPKALWRPVNRSPKKLARLKHSMTMAAMRRFA